MTDLQFAPAHEIADAVRRRQVSPVDVVRAAFDRLERLNPALNAFVVLRAEAALDEARGLEARIARGEDPGLLAGVPFAVKDEEDVGGLPTTYGSAPYRNSIAPQDSTQVARARAAGAIPIGKTNLPEFGSTAFTKNHVFGTTRNPWDLARTPGGSSGGSSAAVAAGIVPCATGGDGGGSIRIPAAYTGLVGMKATFGRIPRGRFDFRDWFDTISRGPLTRTVRDTAIWLDAVAGYDPTDPDSLPDSEHRFAEGLDETPRGLRVAYLPSLGYGHVAADVKRVTDEAVGALASALDVQVDAPAVHLTDVGMAWAFINGFQTYGRLAPMIERHRDEFGRGFLKGVELGGRLGASDIARCQQERYRLNCEVADLFARYDLLVTPTCPTTAFAAGGPMPDTVDGVKLASPLHAVAFTYPFNMTGHPGISLPAGLGDGGLPIGLQIIAERGRDRVLLRVAQAFERARPYPRWPAVPQGTP